MNCCALPRPHSRRTPLFEDKENHTYRSQRSCTTPSYLPPVDGLARDAVKTPRQWPGPRTDCATNGHVGPNIISLRRPFACTHPRCPCSSDVLCLNHTTNLPIVRRRGRTGGESDTGENGATFAPLFADKGPRPPVSNGKQRYCVWVVARTGGLRMKFGPGDIRPPKKLEIPHKF